MRTCWSQCMWQCHLLLYTCEQSASTGGRRTQGCWCHVPQTWFLSPQALCWCNKQLHLVSFKTKPVVPSTELKSLQWLARAFSQGNLSISAVKQKKTLCQSVSEYNTMTLPASPRDHLKDFWILLGKSIFFFHNKLQHILSCHHCLTVLYAVFVLCTWT